MSQIIDEGVVALAPDKKPQLSRHHAACIFVIGLVLGAWIQHEYYNFFEVECGDTAGDMTDHQQ